MGNFFLEQCIEVNTQTVLGRQTINSLVTNFLQCTCAEKCENWLRVDKV